jgi:hypothetical protein
MGVGIDRKKIEERGSAMRPSQLGGLVGYERIFSIICSLVYPRILITGEFPESGPSDILLITAGTGDYVTSSASVPSNRGNGNNRV